MAGKPVKVILPFAGEVLFQFQKFCVRKEYIFISAISGGGVKCSKIVYRLCNHMVYSFDILKASQKKRKRWRWLGRKGLWK